MPPHVQQYVLSQMASELRGGRATRARPYSRVPDGPSKASVMEAALERIGLDAGVAAF